MSDIIWQPYGDYLEKSNISRFMKKHHIKTYEELLQKSSADISWFWEEALKDLGIEWYQPYTKVVEGGLPWAKWFVGGKLNLIHNVLDRHLPRLQDKIAFIWEPDTGSSKKVTYGELARQVSRVASALKKLGIQKGDRIGLYMPMIPEMVVAFLATLKIGAVIIPVFSGFASQALATRLKDAEAKIIFTADGSQRRGKLIDIKKSADEAVKEVSSIKNVVVVKRMDSSVTWNQEKDLWWDNFLKSGTESFSTEKTEAEDQSLIIYTSGTTGKPKGTVHTHAGCQAQMAKELGYYFDVKEDSIFLGDGHWLDDGPLGNFRCDDFCWNIRNF